MSVQSLVNRGELALAKEVYLLVPATMVIRTARRSVRMTPRQHGHT